MTGQANAPGSRRTTRAGVEFLLLGGGTLVLIPLLTLGRATLGFDTTELAIGFTMFHAALLINDPHFAVTYLLFYRGFFEKLATSRTLSRRVRLLGAGLVAPLALVSWTAHALYTRSATELGILLQLMFFSVGWHYAKQGFGALLILSAQRGLTYTRRERIALLAHCHAGWLYAWANPADVGSSAVAHGVYYRTWPHPEGLEPFCAIAFSLSALNLLGVLLFKWRREGVCPPLSGLVAFLASIWLWMVFSRAEPLLYYAIPALHSVQYLFFVWRLRHSEASEAEAALQGTVRQRLGLLAIGAVGLGWFLLKGGPALADATVLLAQSELERSRSALGPTPFLAAFVATVNLHHYAMDAVLWRRDNDELRHLRT